jgi:hypothetical protein
VIVDDTYADGGQEDSFIIETSTGRVVGVELGTDTPEYCDSKALIWVGGRGSSR